MGFLETLQTSGISHESSAEEQDRSIQFDLFCWYKCGRQEISKRTEHCYYFSRASIIECMPCLFYKSDERDKCPCEIQVSFK